MSTLTLLPNALETLAGMQSEPPFLGVQLLCVVQFTVLTILAAVKFRAHDAVVAVA